MADPALNAAMSTLQLDPETGEMVSKNELKKRTKKRAAKVAAAEHKSKAKPDTVKPIKDENDNLSDISTIFKQGFLAEVYKERPGKPVVTRFPPEVNFLNMFKMKCY
jgi:glutaminyl-tRNA synthetase